MFVGALNHSMLPQHTLGYNNLGSNLTLVGKWERAHEALKHALELAFEVDERGAQVPMILDSVGDLKMMRGELEDARSLLERAVKLATEHGNEWYADRPCARSGAAISRRTTSSAGSTCAAMRSWWPSASFWAEAA